MAFLLFDTFRQFTADDGTILAGGSLAFTDPLTTLDKDVYADRALGTSLGPEVTLDAAGRSAQPIWVSGLVNVELLDSDAVQVGLCENMGEDLSGITLPDPASGDEGDSLTTDGVNWLLQALLAVPDPTSQSGKYLGSDGTAVPLWTAFPASVTYDADHLPGGITSAATRLVVGNYALLIGSGTIPTSGTDSSSVAVTFGTAFTAAPKVVACATVGVVTAGGAHASVQAVGASTTGFTAHAYAGAEHGSLATNISTAVTFDFIAWGLA